MAACWRGFGLCLSADYRVDLSFYLKFFGCLYLWMFIVCIYVIGFTESYGIALIFVCWKLYIAQIVYWLEGSFSCMNDILIFQPTTCMFTWLLLHCMVYCLLMREPHTVYITCVLFVTLVASLQMLSANRSELLELRGPRKSTHIDRDLFHKLKCFGICNTLSTRRGTRAGKQNKYTARKKPLTTGHNYPPTRSRSDITQSSKNTSVPHKQRLDVCFFNAQSVCNKVDVVTDYVIEQDIDIVAITETWLTNEDKHAFTSAELKPSGYVLQQVPREGRTGGGIALLHKEEIRCEMLPSFKAASFENQIVSVT